MILVFTVLPFRALKYTCYEYILSKDDEIVIKFLFKKFRITWDKVLVRYLNTDKKLEISIDLGKGYGEFVKRYDEDSNEFENLIYLVNLHSVKIENI